MKMCVSLFTECLMYLNILKSHLNIYKSQEKVGTDVLIVLIMLM